MCWYGRDGLFFDPKELVERLLWCLSGNASSSLGRNSRSVVMVLKLHEQEGNNVLKHVNIDLQRCMMMRESQGFVCFSCKSRLHRYVCSIEGVARRRTQAVIKDGYEVTVVTRRGNEAGVKDGCEVTIVTRRGPKATLVRGRKLRHVWSIEGVAWGRTQASVVRWCKLRLLRSVRHVVRVIQWALGWIWISRIMWLDRYIWEGNISVIGAEVV